jgi:hypothetical protein
MDEPGTSRLSPTVLLVDDEPVIRAFSRAVSKPVATG